MAHDSTVLPFHFSVNARREKRTGSRLQADSKEPGVIPSGLILRFDADDKRLCGVEQVRGGWASQLNVNDSIVFVNNRDDACLMLEELQDGTVPREVFVSRRLGGA